MSESHASSSHHHGHAPAGRPTLVPLGGALGIAGCLLGLVIFLAACAGQGAAFRFAWIAVVLGGVGFLLSVIGGVIERPKLAEDTAVLGALFACCMALIGGLLEMAVQHNWALFPHA